MASVGYNCVRQILETACILSSSCFPARSQCVQMQWLVAPSTLLMHFFFLMLFVCHMTEICSLDLECTTTVMNSDSDDPDRRNI